MWYEHELETTIHALIFGLLESQKLLQESNEFLSAFVRPYVFRMKEKGVVIEGEQVHPLQQRNQSWSRTSCGNNSTAQVFSLQEREKKWFSFVFIFLFNFQFHFFLISEKCLILYFFPSLALCVKKGEKKCIYFSVILEKFGRWFIVFNLNLYYFWNNLIQVQLSN